MFMVHFRYHITLDVFYLFKFRLLIMSEEKESADKDEKEEMAKKLADGARGNVYHECLLGSESEEEFIKSATELWKTRGMTGARNFLHLFDGKRTTWAATDVWKFVEK